MQQCKQCGANLALVGRTHRCIPRADVVVHKDDVVVNTDDVVVNKPKPECSHNTGKPRSADRHKATDRRRAYMRDYMAKRRIGV